MVGSASEEERLKNKTRPTLHQPDAAIAAVIGGATRIEVVCWQRGFPRSRRAGYAYRWAVASFKPGTLKSKLGGYVAKASAPIEKLSVG